MVHVAVAYLRAMIVPLLPPVLCSLGQSGGPFGSMQAAPSNLLFFLLSFWCSAKRLALLVGQSNLA